MWNEHSSTVNTSDWSLDQWNETTGGWGSLYNLVKPYKLLVQSLSQALEGYSCSVDKKQIQRDAAPRQAYQLTSRCGWWLTSPPLTHCDNYRPVESTYSDYRVSTVDWTCAQAASMWIHVSTDLITSGPAASNSRRREIQFLIPRNFNESRVSQVSLTCLVSRLHWSIMHVVFQLSQACQQ